MWSPPTAMQCSQTIMLCGCAAAASYLCMHRARKHKHHSLPTRPRTCRQTARYRTCRQNCQILPHVCITRKWVGAETPRPAPPGCSAQMQQGHRHDSYPCQIVKSHRRSAGRAHGTCIRSQSPPPPHTQAGEAILACRLRTLRTGRAGWPGTSSSSSCSRLQAVAGGYYCHPTQRVAYIMHARQRAAN